MATRRTAASSKKKGKTIKAQAKTSASVKARKTAKDSCCMPMSSCGTARKSGW